MSTQTQISLAHLSILDQIRAISLEGLKYAVDPYDIARYNKLLTLAVREYSEVLHLDESFLLNKFQSEIGITTPKIGSEAGIVNSSREILVLKRTDDHSWCLPCGWVDVGENPAETAVRETKEETGLNVEPDCYIALSHKGPHTASYLQHQINIITMMKPLTSEPHIKLSQEHSDYKWIKDGELLNWHTGHDIQIRKIFQFLFSEEKLHIAVT